MNSLQRTPLGLPTEILLLVVSHLFSPDSTSQSSTAANDAGGSLRPLACLGRLLSTSKVYFEFPVDCLPEVIQKCCAELRQVLWAHAAHCFLEPIAALLEGAPVCGFDALKSIVSKLHAVHAGNSHCQFHSTANMCQCQGSRCSHLHWQFHCQCLP